MCRLCSVYCRGFSYVDLIEDARTHKDYALKRITCHSKEEERLALQEVELMKTFQHPNIIPLKESTVIKVNQYSKHLDIVSEVLIVMPYYSVSYSKHLDIVSGVFIVMPYYSVSYSKHLDIVSEVLIVMPYYSVSYSKHLDIVSGVLIVMPYYSVSYSKHLDIVSEVLIVMSVKFS